MNGVEKDSFRREIEGVINCHCAENGSNTPDYILAHYLLHCLEAFDEAVNSRSEWYGRYDEPGGSK